jgi:hypothetical protein
MERRVVGDTPTRKSPRKHQGRRIDMLSSSRCFALLVCILTFSVKAWCEDLSSATDPLPPGTFTTWQHSDEWKIRNASAAAPSLSDCHRVHRTSYARWLIDPELRHDLIRRRVSTVCVRAARIIRSAASGARLCKERARRCGRSRNRLM